MRIEISSNLFVVGMPRDVAERARHELTVPNPEYVKRERLGKWLGDTKPELTLFSYCGDGLSILPRGYLERLMRLAGESGEAVTIADERLALPEIELTFNGELRDYQQRAFDAMTRRADGVLVAPCGAGKTALAMSLIAHCKQPALVLVHTTDLLKQTREAARRWLGVEAGIIGNGKIDIRPITVGTVQTVRKCPQLARLFGCVVLDECHHCPASTFTNTLQMFPAAFRYGLTATPRRDDGLSSFMTAALGLVRHTITREELCTADVLVVPRIEFVRTAFEYRYTDDWATMISALTHDADRNNLLYRVICRLLDDGRRVLALSQRVGHCEAFYRAVEHYRPGAAALAVCTRKKERIEGIRRIVSGEAQVLFATQLADEGLDAPVLDALILMTPQRSDNRTIQRVGRVSRALDGKRQPIVTDCSGSRKMSAKFPRKMSGRESHRTEIAG
jgi:superfamily II DNA or RNA helicase